MANIRNVAADEAVIAIAALAALVPLVAGQFDVSVGAVLGMVSIAVAALTVRAGLPVFAALPLGVALGAVTGAVSVNGLTLAGAADWVDPLFNGAAVVVAVAVSTSTVLAHRRGSVAAG